MLSALDSWTIWFDSRKRFYLVVNFSLFVFLALVLRPLFRNLQDLSLAEVINLKPISSLYILIHLYPSLSILIHPYPSLSILIHPHPSLSILIYPYLSLSILIHPYPFLSILIHSIVLNTMLLLNHFPLTNAMGGHYLFSFLIDEVNHLKPILSIPIYSQGTSCPKIHRPLQWKQVVHFKRLNLILIRSLHDT